MKNCHCFLLMVMLLVAMVCTATLKHDPLLTDIIQQVEKISKETFEDFAVAKPSNGTPVCVPDFFCLAEKALDPVKSRIHGLRKLHHQIEAYTNKMNQTECTLSDSQYCISELLKEIEKCAKHKITDKDGHVIIRRKL